MGDKSKRGQTTIRLCIELYEELRAISEQTGLTITALLTVAIWRSVLGPKYSRQ